MIHVMASGILFGAPQRRTSAKGTDYCTGLVKSPGKDGDCFVSFVCFSDDAQAELLALSAGDAVAISGMGKLTAWTGRDGQEKHGLSIVAERVLPHKPTPKAKAKPKPPAAPATAEAEPFNDSIPF